MITLKTIDSQFYRVLGKCIHTKRIEKGMTLQEVSKRVGITRQMLDLYELGRCRIKGNVYEKICEVLDIYSGIEINVKIGL